MGQVAEKINEYQVIQGNIRSYLEGKKIVQGNRFEYRGGTVTCDGKSEVEVRKGFRCVRMRGGWR